MTEPERPSRVIASPDGTPVAVFTNGDGPPLVLVHGASADHTTFRVVGPTKVQPRRFNARDSSMDSGEVDIFIRTS